MTDKKNESNSEKTEEQSVFKDSNQQQESSDDKTRQKSEKSSHKQVFNWIFALILVLIALAIYGYQKGYLQNVNTLFDRSKPASQNSSQINDLSAAQSKASKTSSSTIPEVEGASPSLPQAEAFVNSDENLVEEKSLEGRLSSLENALESMREQSNPNAQSFAQSASQTYQQLEKLRAQIMITQLKQAVFSGFPFEAELKIAQALLTEIDFEMLSPLAKLGLPSREGLIEELEVLMREIVLREKEQNAAGFLEKLKMKFFGLIRVSRKEDNSILKLPAEVTAARAGDFAPALMLLKESGISTPRAKIWTIHASAYQDAKQILDALAQQYFSSLDLEAHSSEVLNSFALDLGEDAS